MAPYRVLNRDLVLGEVAWGEEAGSRPPAALLRGIWRTLDSGKGMTYTQRRRAREQVQRLQWVAHGLGICCLMLQALLYVAGVYVAPVFFLLSAGVVPIIAMLLIAAATAGCWLPPVLRMLERPSSN